jgi:hypothetical protein
MKRFAVLCLALFACEGKVGVATLIKTTPETTSAKCPAGGVLIQSGPDSDRNQVLDDSEVTQSSEVCTGATGMNGMNGNNGAAPLMVTTPLGPGDPHCSGGGTRIDVGFDDGKGGGTAGDGVLQPGEISSTRYVCNGSFPYFPGDTTPPAGPAGQYQIVTRGGSTTTGEVGSGGNVRLSLSSGSLGGHVKVFSSGVADAGFTVPTMVPFSAGTTPLAVSNDLTVHAYDSLDAGVASHDAFFRFADRLYTAALGQVTSITVAQNKTLTLENPNDDDLILSGDFRNAGTVKTVADLNGHPAKLAVSVNRFVTDPGSHIFADGVNNPVMGNSGGLGGTVVVSASALVLNWGDISVKGGIADTGGPGGAITFTAQYGPLYNLGSLDASGASGNVNGGSAGGVQLYTFNTEIFNSGNLSAAGGSGTAKSGNGGTLHFGEAVSGPLRNSGRLAAQAGACLGGGGCQGGSGGHVMLFAANGELVSSGDITASGASGMGAGPGGPGGNIEVHSQEQTGPAGDVALPTGSLVLSGNLFTSGGDGVPAGSGGNLTVTLDPRNNPLGQELILLGYTKVDLSGGSGTTGNGGAAGQLELSNSVSSFHQLAGPGGGAFLYADVLAKGGDGSAGGQGGFISVRSQTDMNFGLANEAAGVMGSSIDFSGGVGHSGSGANAGAVSVIGLGAAENRAKLTGLGGQASGGPAPGGQGGNVSLLSDDGAVTNTGDVDLSGGASSGSGGQGGDLTFTGVTLTTGGALKSKGGNGTVLGGQGGLMRLWATGGGMTSSTSTFDVAGGTGAPAGAKGQVLIDGADVTP